MSTITHPPVREALKHLEALYSEEEFRLLVESREQGLIDAEDARDYAHHEGREEGLQEGMEKGLEQGLEKGLQKGASGVLEQLLSRRFGPLPAAITERLSHADTEQIQAWSLNVLEAQTLEDVFRE